jgi:hypothetical protein
MAKPRETAPKGIAQTLPPMSKNPEAIEARARELLASETRPLRSYSATEPLYPESVALRAITVALQLSSAVIEIAEEEEEKAYEIGKSDGYGSAVQDIDLLTGGDGEYFASTIPGRGCPDAATMKAGIVARFDALSNPSPASNGDEGGAVSIRKEIQQDRLRAAVDHLSAGNSEVEPDDRQHQERGSPDRQGSEGREVGGRDALLAGGLQRSERDVLAEGVEGVADPARVSEARAASSAPIAEGHLRAALEKYRRFAGETAGACLGLAMSTDHPAPDEVLMGIFHKSQALAAETSTVLAALNVPSDAVSQSQMVGLTEALELWRLKDGYVPAYIAGWNAMLDKAIDALASLRVNEVGK